jgi:hypothetical protein
MPKNQVSDPITDQEVAFAHLVLSGTMTDRRAAEAAGLNPDTAAYTKANPGSAPTWSSTGPPCTIASCSKNLRSSAGRTWAASESWPASGKSPTWTPT